MMQFGNYGNYFSHLSNCEVNSRISLFTLQRNLQEMCAYMYLVGQLTASPDDLHYNPEFFDRALRRMRGCVCCPYEQCLRSRVEVE